MTKTARTQKIKEAAQRLGFHLVGITSANPVEKDGAFFLSWLKEGHAAEMAYLKKSPETRIAPKIRFPEAMSVICLAMNYYQTSTPSSPPPERGRDVKEEGLTGKVARYAWGEDYHTVIEEKLAKLIAVITDLGGKCFKGYVDHGPLLERAFAQRAGIGFIGKNTNVITKKYGSWVFLAEVVTDMALLYDTPALPACGACRLCIDACPTGALVSPYRLDAGKCLSYLTIENKGPIPETVFDRLEEFLFGCDICQEVCPYNRDVAQTDEARLAKEHGAGETVSLADILAIPNKEAFVNRFGHTPLMRAKQEGLVRNAKALLCAAEGKT